MECSSVPYTILPLLHRTKVHAQRKFAQGAYNFTAPKEKEKENGLANGQSISSNDPPNEEPLDACPNTEDFLTFLCYRSLPGVLPESLSYFADPIRHNYPDGVLPSESKLSSAKTRQKQNGLNSHQEEVKVAKKVLKQVKKELIAKHKRSTALNQSILGSGRIHSNFRRRSVASAVITRLGRTQPNNKDPSANKKHHKKIAQTPGKKLHKINTSKKVIETRSRRRTRSRIGSDSSSVNESSSSNESSEVADSTDSSELSSSSASTSSEDSESSEEEKTPKKVPKKSLAKIKAEQLEKARRLSKQKKPLATAKTKNAKKTVFSPKITRTSAAEQLSNKILRSTNVMSQRLERAMRRNSAPTKKIQETSHISTRLRSATAPRALSPVKSPRKPPEKSTTRRTTSENVISPIRRPMRRTKEAATIYMTILGHDEGLDSSDIEDVVVEKTKRGEKRTSNAAQNKTVNGRKREPSAEPMMTRTRRNCASATNSPLAKRRATILREAAKRFTAAQSDSESSSDSSSSATESSSEASSSDEEIALPKRSMRTRSFVPSASEKSSKETTQVVSRTRSKREAPPKEVDKKTSGKTSSTVRVTNGKLQERTEDKQEREKAVPEKPNPKNRKRPVSKRPITPPLSLDLTSLLDAPVFHPSEKEFSDPMEYLEKIRPECERFGICRIVPPASFKPECQVSDAMRFTAYNQYVHRMFRRRGPNTRILQAIQRHLKSMGIDYQNAPCIGGIEVDLPGLYEAVEELGGPGFVLQNNLWSKVADKMKVTIPKFRFDKSLL